jgi:hypothetical protein
MICGLLLGCCLGLLCLFWFKESVFTRRHQMGKKLSVIMTRTVTHLVLGILAGMFINFCCGVNYVYY